MQSTSTVTVEVGPELSGRLAKYPPEQVNAALAGEAARFVHHRETMARLAPMAVAPNQARREFTRQAEALECVFVGHPGASRPNGSAVGRDGRGQWFRVSLAGNVVTAREITRAEALRAWADGHEMDAADKFVCTTWQDGACVALLREVAALVKGGCEVNPNEQDRRHRFFVSSCNVEDALLNVRFRAVTLCCVLEGLTTLAVEGYEDLARRHDKVEAVYYSVGYELPAAIEQLKNRISELSDLVIKCPEALQGMK